MKRIGLLVLASIMLGCSGGDDGTLTIYSGRNERLIGPLLERFTEETGTEVKVRYGGTSELTATLLEEGQRSPAAVFIAQDSAALGALSRAGILNTLPDDVLERVPARFRSEADDWVGLSGRARVVVYNTDATSVDELPHSLSDASAPRFRGRFGLAPTNASFQAHMAMYRALHGEDSLTALLHGIAGNEPRLFDGNSAIVRAVAAGEIDWGLVNHYYLWRLLKEDPSIAAANHFQPDGGSNFVNMAGAGIVSEHAGARELLRYLVSDAAQRYFADETFEYPLVPGMAASVDLPALEQIDTPTLGYQAVAESLEPALEQIRQSGLTGFR